MHRKIHPVYVIFLMLMALIGLAGVMLLICGLRHPAPVTPLALWLQLAQGAIYG